ncbi:MAG: cobalt-precorrin 5A hydrolase [Schwartzia sp.]|nr:cobalt-precorrin 5A hydrolase [Schwartzia sp. (in: firmicutes)]
MRCAVFTATTPGVALAGRLQAALEDSVDVFVKEGRPAPESVHRYRSLGEAVTSAFERYDALIFLMAAGIAVRMIAPCLKGKLTDSAVVTVDEQARFAISLLSGHVGGANELTRRVADILGAVPVITTATDARSLTAPDAIATELGLMPRPKPQIQVLNNALLEGRPVRWYLDPEMKRAGFYRQALTAKGIAFAEVSAAEAAANHELAALITDNAPPEREGLLALLPRRLIAGIGCRRGTPVSAIRDALSDACRRIGQEIAAVSLIASAEVKKDEAGLLALAEELGVEARFFGRESLQEMIENYHLAESEFVKRQIGAGNVSEAAALCAAGQGRMALPKTKYTKVTVALVWER